MLPIYENIEATLLGGEEALQRLETEYAASVRLSMVTPRAKRLAHDVCVQVRSALDLAARRYWEKHVSPDLSELERRRASIYFPITANPQSFGSVMGRWNWGDVSHRHKEAYDFLAALQPFNGARNHWLRLVNDLAISGKHVDLLAQRRNERRETRVVLEPGESFSFVRDGETTFTSRDGTFQGSEALRQMLSRRRSGHWVSFVIEGLEVDAIVFCEIACTKGRRIVVEMTQRFDLS